MTDPSVTNAMPHEQILQQSRLINSDPDRAGVYIEFRFEEFQDG